MKKGKVLGKGQITVALLVLSLGAAVWLNAKYAPTSTKYLGEASYVSAKSETKAVETSAKAQSSDYFTTAKKEREAAKKEAIETIEELLDSDKLTDKDKQSALVQIEKIGKNIEKEVEIESLIKAKGFEKCLAIINDKGVNIVVKSEGLSTDQTVQIQDIITQNTDISLNNIKIIPVAK